MFTGIVEATAEILERSEMGLTLARPDSFDDIKEGMSICVSGACLSVTKFDASSMWFDVVSETWSRTKLGSLQAGDRVNLERSLRPSDRFDGHIVQGHVEGVATVRTVERGENQTVIRLELASDLASLVVPKGSICIDGVSLTVAQKNDQQFCSVVLIPHTLAHTTLGTIKEGDKVNIETDILGRYIAALIPQHSGSATRVFSITHEGGSAGADRPRLFLLL